MTATGAPEQLCTHLSAAQLDELRATLLRARVFRTDQLLGLAHEKDAGDAATREVARELFGAARSALHAVQAAIWRMDEGVYGRCTACAGAVEWVVLEAVPHASLCLSCHALAP